MLDWRTEEVSKLLGKDPQLIRLFCDIKTEMYWFRKFICSTDCFTNHRFLRQLPTFSFNPVEKVADGQHLDGEIDRLYSGDALFKTLVVDNERKLLTAHIKAAKRQGVL